ncbi:MAG TPA: TIGR03915 family putative DNA repair protein [Candidatus Copromorpha excrementigallinarum]|uniref:TIGR03915 family putative DNA repair protein n=1 Tax=Candidatus Allocopromorpha excrementigallinarum TaxID=2840742 RepID=A0A9D1L6F9_9FIRM|nr:TIGR03915 family putative DNA repair protein [Candidatus Copromorpha excrementigallinarum]
MLDYLYDGTFEGLLTCVHHHYYTDRASGIFRGEYYQSNMLGGFMEVETDPHKAAVVYEAVERKISSYDLKRVYRAFLSEEDNKEMKILRYLVLGFREGGRISMLHGNPVVFDLQQAEYKVTREVDRMLGLLRFSAVKGGILYSAIEPDNDILELIAGHFCDRLKNDPFIVHDLKRKKALIAYRRQWYISAFEEKDTPEAAEDEIKYRRLWKSYFENIAIKERTNPRCQKNFMPVRYWKHLTEFTTEKG